MSPHHARALIAERGLRLEPFGPAAYRVHGRGVDVMVSDLHWLKESDLRPPRRERVAEAHTAQRQR